MEEYKEKTKQKLMELEQQKEADLLKKIQELPE